MRLPLAGEAGEVVVVGAAHEDVAMVAVGGGLLAQGLGVDEEPGEGFALDVAVLHPVGQFAIVAFDAREVDDAVLVLEHVADVAGVA